MLLQGAMIIEGGKEGAGYDLIIDIAYMLRPGLVEGADLF